MPPEPVDGLPILLRMRQEQERSNLDEGNLWAENTKLQNDLNKLKQKERKMLQADNLVQKQLLYSEEQRYQLEAKLAAATDDCHSKTKLLDESSTTFGKASVRLDGVKFRFRFPQQRTRIYQPQQGNEDSGKPSVSNQA
ncbi:hypothetical protein PGTUg99_030078 [Puccinia graminis f. sp. tritici]|uniref:Uncharacterized protein n=1 Tax=Puccinia graminis f. sp. tritici TaxID=56615 RepID=A0A5B0R749_PUCGR|nr:hypothetical protein PGTUg99_030078 [Puccinia graminis f. sp. tritici]